MEGYKHIPLVFPRIPADEQLRASRDFLSRMSGRRSVLLFSPEPVPLELIENALRCASLAPSGANQHPWRLVVVEPTARGSLRDSPPNPGRKQEGQRGEEGSDRDSAADYGGECGNRAERQ